MAIIKGTARADILIGTINADEFYVNNTGDTIVGGNDQDRVLSFLASYQLQDGLGNLILGTGAIAGTGNAGSNVIAGNKRDNVLDGGAGMDELFGGAGRDTFLFSHAGQFNADDIQDYEAGYDRIAVSGAAFGLAAGTPVDYELNRQATTTAPTFIRQGTLGTAQAIYFDRDGVGIEKAQLLCVLPGFAGATSAADFAIV